MPVPTYYVFPDRGEWVLRKRGNMKATGRFARKKDAVQRGWEAAKNQEGQLVIRKKDGKIQEEWTYGKDPYPPKG